MAETEDERRQTTAMLQRLELLLRLGEMAEADKVLAEDVEGLFSPTLLGMITLTRHAKASLFLRNDFLGRAEAVLTKRLGKERTESLLKNRR